MSKLKLFIITALTAAMVGCSLPALNSNIGASKNIEEKTVKNNSDELKENPEKAQENGGAEEDTGRQEPAPEVPAQPNSEPEPRKGIKLNYEVLNKLDNTKYSWNFKLNSEHKTPAIPSYARRLIDRYDGIFTGDTSKKVIYLTFDEGYENGYTPKILDTLRENDVRAAFFVTGPYIRKNADLVKRMLDEGHVVGNHTVNHPSLPGTDNETLEKELYGLEEQFRSSFGVGFKYMRPPMGEYSERVLAAAQQLGYKTAFWSFAYRDWEVNKQKGADYAYKMVMNNLHNGAVLLLHAVSKDNAEALDRIIKDIKALGYEIRPFDL